MTPEEHLQEVKTLLANPSLPLPAFTEEEAERLVKETIDVDHLAFRLEFYNSTAGDGDEGSQGETPVDDDSETEQKWVVVDEFGEFSNVDEARVFIESCQPITYVPDPQHPNQWLASPEAPSGTAIQRRFRIRLDRIKPRERGFVRRGSALGEVVMESPRTCYVVEANDTPIFAVKDPRQLRQTPPKLFLAVDSEHVKQVLREGYQSVRRKSIPTSLTAAQAVEAFTERHPNVRCTILAIAKIPPGVDVIQSGKFGSAAILTQFLPPECIVRHVAEDGSIKSHLVDNGPARARARTISSPPRRGATLRSATTRQATTPRGAV
jgi:hypothetical protein